MYEYPPILRGDPAHQLAQLRDYLVRMARQEQSAGQAVSTSLPSAGAVAQAARTSAAGSTAALETVEDARKRAAALKALIVKTADRAAVAETNSNNALSRANAVETSVGELAYEMHTEYLAQSDFGSYAQQVTAQIEANARAITESYSYAELVSAAAAAGVNESLEQYMTLINGQIRRGYLTDPATGETVIGIAVSQKLQFTGSTQTVDGEVCYELDAAQTFGLYTSTGWQFWVGGQKIGWFDSADGMLHVVRMVAEQELKLGDDWLITTAGGFGIRYLGG